MIRKIMHFIYPTEIILKNPLDHKLKEICDNYQEIIDFLEPIDLERIDKQWISFLKECKRTILRINSKKKQKCINTLITLSRQTFSGMGTYNDLHLGQSNEIFNKNQELKERLNNNLNDCINKIEDGEL